MAEKQCQVVECINPECEGNPYEVDSSQPESVRMIQAGLVEGWDTAHRSAVKHAQVLMRALTYGALEVVEGKPLTHGGGEGWRINLARQELAEEASDG